MNPQEPLGKKEESLLFTPKALGAKFSFSFTRKQLIVLMNALNPIQLPLGDLRTEILTEMRKEINNAAFNSVIDSDLVKQDGKAQAPLPPMPTVQTK